MSIRIFLLFFFIFSFLTALAKTDETGYSAAMKYFTNKSSTKTRKKSRFISNQSLLAFSIGNSINNKIYGQFNPTPLWSSEIFYQSHSGSYVAKAFHLEWQQFPWKSNKTDKLGLLFSLSFPRSMSFPFYLGIAAGPGFFIKPENKKSEWSLDSRFYLGFRLTGNHIQYFCQTGFKNHLLKFRESVLPGWFLSMGLAYRF